MSKKNIYYSDKYYDDVYEYRHVMLPKDLAKLVPKTHLMSENEWRALGVQQSQVRRSPHLGPILGRPIIDVRQINSIST